MKKITVFTILIILITISCSQPASKETQRSLVSELDTFYLGDKLVNVEKISKMYFDKIQTNGSISKNYKNWIQ